MYYKACRKSFPVLCTTKFAESRSQYYFLLQSLHKLLPSTTVYYKTCTKSFPVLLCATKLARSMFQYYFELQSSHKALPSTTLYYKACTKHVPVLLCTTKLAQSTTQYDFVLQRLLAQSTSQHYHVLQSLHKALPQPLQQVGAKSASPWSVKIHNNQTSSVWHEHIIQHVPISLIHWNICGYGIQFRNKTSLWNSKTCTEERRWHNPYACQHWGSESQKAFQQTKVTTGTHGKKHELQCVFISGNCFINTSECLSRASGPERGQHRVAQRTRGNTSRESKEWLWMPNNE